MNTLSRNNAQQFLDKAGKAGGVLLISLHADPATPSGIAEGGGTHSYLRELLRCMALEQRKAIVVTRHADIALPKIQRLSDFTSVYRIQLGEIARIDKALLNDFHDVTVSLILKIIAELPWEVKVLHGVYWNSGRAAMDISKILKIPFVQTVISNGHRRLKEGFFDNAKKRIEIEQLVYESASTVLCISTEEKNDLIEFYKIESEKIFVIGRPVSNYFSNPAQSLNGVPKYIDLHFEGDRNGC